MNNKFVYTPGPTEVRENVRLSRAQSVTNPDVDVEFIDFYKNTCDKIGKIIQTSNDVYILNGEGILGLEAACASLTEEGDRVLVIDNGIFGNGFKDFVSMYGGDPVLFASDYSRGIDISDLREYLKNDSDFKYATIVHCDTPTGVLNDLSEICPLLKEHNILTVVDSVSSMGGEMLEVDKWNIDIALGGSQKALSAAPGLTIVSISEDAKIVIANRKTSIKGFYCNLSIWEKYYENQWFPYTMPISDIIGLDKALDNILEEGIENVLHRHKTISLATRDTFVEFGIELFLDSGYSSTVTAIKIPEYIGANKLVKHMREKYKTILSTSLGVYSNEILRIGHMGENARFDKILSVLSIISRSLSELGYEGDKCIVELFNKQYKI